MNFANVKSVADYQACYHNFIDYAFEAGPQPQGKTMVYEFEDGERLELPLVKGFMGDEKDRNKFFHQYSLNRHKDSPIGIRQLNDSVLYIGISTELGLHTEKMLLGENNADRERIRELAVTAALYFALKETEKLSKAEVW